MGKLTWSLGDPSLGPFERLGLAGLYMALAAAEKDSHDLSPLEFELTRDSVELTWPDTVKDQDALVPVVEWAWQANGAPKGADPDDRLGVLFLPGIHRGAKAGQFQERLTENGGILSTFLQHSQTQPKSSQLVQVFEIEGRQVELRWVEPKKNLKYPQEVSGNTLFSRGLLRTDSVSVSSFLIPGATTRYGKVVEPSWEGAASLAFLLFFAPTACYFMHIRRREWVVVAPDVMDLEVYSDLRANVGIDFIDARAISLADAGLAVMTALATRGFREEAGFEYGVPAKCSAFRIGKVAWNSNQSVRSNALQVRASLQQVRAYTHIRECLSNRWVETKRDGEEVSFLSIPLARDPITANVLEQRYWYQDLFEVPKYHQESTQQKSHGTESVESTWFRLLGYERKGLRALFEHLSHHQEDHLEETFLNAFDHALRSRYRQEAEHSQRGSRSRADRWEDLRDQIRRSLMRANTRPVLRGVLAEFFAEAGHNPVLRDHRIELWHFIDGQHSWKQARDLALLGLVSYSGSTQASGEEE